jgi:hypothetical protein
MSSARVGGIADRGLGHQNDKIPAWRAFATPVPTVRARATVLRRRAAIDSARCRVWSRTRTTAGRRVDGGSRAERELQRREGEERVERLQATLPRRRDVRNTSALIADAREIVDLAGRRLNPKSSLGRFLSWAAAQAARADTHAERLILRSHVPFQSWTCRGPACESARG